MPDKTDNLTKARTQLVLHHPFFASLLYGLETVMTDKVETAAVNNTHLYINPKFIESMSVPELVFLLAHEVLHPALSHATRADKRDHMRWNAACDYVINGLLIAEGVGSMPKGGLHDPALVARSGGASERVYDNIKNQQQKLQFASGGAQGPFDNILPNSGGTPEQNRLEQDMKVRLAQARNAAKKAGKLSPGLDRLVGELTEPKVDWKAVLREFITSRAKVDWTYAKPKRRFLAQDIYLPGMSGEQMGDLAVAIDCSGSVGEAELNEFASEIKGIVEDVRPQNLHIIYFDSEIAGYELFNVGEGDNIQIKAKGGGGTAFSPIFSFISTQTLEIECCVVLTDLECSDYGPEPAYPVLWAVNKKGMTPKWGRKVEMC